jgi:GGDEF domain-containing protein
VDPCTGLAKRPEAEAAMQRALDAGPGSETNSYAAVFYIHRMALTNARFGEAIGNQVVLFCSQQLATGVTRANDSLFRWSGPAFVAILERAESESAVNSEIQRLISSPFSRFFETSSRSVYLPMKITGKVIPLFDTNFAEVSGQLDNFILTASGQALAED